MPANRPIIPITLIICLIRGNASTQLTNDLTSTGSWAILVNARAVVSCKLDLAEHAINFRIIAQAPKLNVGEHSSIHLLATN